METTTIPAQKPMTTQEVIDLITPIPEDQFCVNSYCKSVEDKECCCVMGWVNKHVAQKANHSLENTYESSYYYDEETNITEVPLRARSRHFISQFGKQVTNFYGSGDIASVNNDPSLAYPQPTPKQRVLALLNDMLAAGY